MKVLGDRAKGPGKIYLTGGASAVLLGWRDSTLDVDLKLDPEPTGVFDALRQAKEDIGINIELASPDDFIPPLPGWKDRCLYIGREGHVEFLHYDFFAQALSKIERQHTQDVRDVRSMYSRNLITTEGLRQYFDAIRPHLDRYPALDADAFSQKLEMIIRQLGDANHGVT